MALVSTERCDVALLGFCMHAWTNGNYKELVCGPIWHLAELSDMILANLWFQQCILCKRERERERRGRVVVVVVVVGVVFESQISSPWSDCPRISTICNCPVNSLFLWLVVIANNEQQLVIICLIVEAKKQLSRFEAHFISSLCSKPNYIHCSLSLSSLPPSIPLSLHSIALLANLLALGLARCSSSRILFSSLLLLLSFLTPPLLLLLLLLLLFEEDQ